MLPSGTGAMSEQAKQRLEECTPEHEIVPHLLKQETRDPHYYSLQKEASCVGSCFNTLLSEPSINVTESNRHALMHLKRQFSHVIRQVQQFSKTTSQRIESMRDSSSQQPLRIHLEMGGEEEECSDLSEQIVKLTESESFLLDALNETDEAAFSLLKSVSLSATGVVVAVLCLLYYDRLLQVSGLVSFFLLLLLGLIAGVGGIVMHRYHTKSYKKAIMAFLQSLNEQLQILRKQLMDLPTRLNSNKGSSQQLACTGDITDILKSLNTVSKMVE